MKGTITKFDPSVGFGYVRADDGTEVYVHQGEAADGAKLRRGARIEFDVDGSDPRGPYAVNIAATGRDSVNVESSTGRGVVRELRGSFGFIGQTGRGKPLFFHMSTARGRVQVGDEVTFEVTLDHRGRFAATKVRRITPQSSGEGK